MTGRAGRSGPRSRAEETPGESNPPAPPHAPRICYWCKRPFGRPSALLMHERFCGEGPAFHVQGRTLEQEIKEAYAHHGYRVIRINMSLSQHPGEVVTHWIQSEPL